MKTKLSKVIVVLLTLSMIFALGACGSGEESPEGEDYSVEAVDGVVDTAAFAKEKDEPYVIGFSNISVVNTWRVQMVYELEAAAEELGVELYMTDAAGDNAKQVSDIQDLIARGIDALLVAPGSSTATIAVQKQALDQGIPVIIFNAEVEDEGSFIGFVGSDATAFGYQIGTWLVDQLGGEGDIIILDGMAGNAINQQREDGLHKAIAELPDGGEKINILATYYADWAYDKGKQASEQALAAYPNIDGVFSQGGAMTQGCIEAFKAAGRDLVPMTGEDNNGFLKLWKQESANGFSSIAASEATWQSAVALETALAALKGEPVQKYNYLDIPSITDENLDDFARPEYSDAYWCNSKLDKETADKYYLE